MAEQKNAQNVDVNQLLKVRREKLQDLQERGKDPFQITKYDMNTSPLIPRISPTSYFLKSA